jgi:thioester reductase-like protein
MPLSELTTTMANIDVVLHCAARVNLLLSYEALRAANVLGSFHVLAEAARVSCFDCFVVRLCAL